MNDSFVTSASFTPKVTAQHNIYEFKLCLDPGCFVAECYYKTVTFAPENCHSELGGVETPSDQLLSSLASSSSSQVNTE